MKQSPIFVKHYDLMAWLIPHTLNFPKSQRGVLARQIQQELFRIHEALVAADICPREKTITVRSWPLLRVQNGRIMKPLRPAG
jgi:hypothetical protein